MTDELYTNQEHWSMMTLYQSWRPEVKTTYLSNRLCVLLKVFHVCYSKNRRPLEIFFHLALTQPLFVHPSRVAGALLDNDFQGCDKILLAIPK